MSVLTNEKYSLPKEHSTLGNIAIAFAYFLTATALATLIFHLVPDNKGNVYIIYLFAMILISKYTNGYVYGIVSSVIAVFCINYIFTYPYFAFNFTLDGYPLTYTVMLSTTLIISTMTSHLTEQGLIIKKHESQLREAALEKMRANLLRAVSHDLRTPLTGIIGNSASYLENGSRLSAVDKDELVRSIYSDANWLLNMVENLLTVTRIQVDSLQISTSLESVEEVVSESLMRLNKRHPKAEIHARVPDEVLFIPMDAILIEQVIINLIENAIVHSGSDSPIELTVTNLPLEVSFSIKDYGRGISPERLLTLFDNSAINIDDSPDCRKGMGIGLSICKTIITAHHGKIYGENHAEGAVFTFHLPKEIK